MAHGSLMLLEEIFFRLPMDNQTRKKLIGTWNHPKKPLPSGSQTWAWWKIINGWLYSHLPTLLSQSNLHLWTHVPIPTSHQPKILRTNYIIYNIYSPSLTSHVPPLKDRFPCCLIVARIASPAKGLGDGLKGPTSSAKAGENRVTKHQSMDWFKGKSTRNHCFFPSNIGGSCKFSQHPVLWIKNEAIFLLWNMMDVSESRRCQ